jgi:hypothetical protein
MGSNLLSKKPSLFFQAFVFLFHFVGAMRNRRSAADGVYCVC